MHSGVCLARAVVGATNYPEACAAHIFHSVGIPQSTRPLPIRGMGKGATVDADRVLNLMSRVQEICGPLVAPSLVEHRFTLISLEMANGLDEEDHGHLEFTVGVIIAIFSIRNHDRPCVVQTTRWLLSAHAVHLAGTINRLEETFSRK